MKVINKTETVVVIPMCHGSMFDQQKVVLIMSDSIQMIWFCMLLNQRLNQTSNPITKLCFSLWYSHEQLQ